ncbi:hypothetical protein [Variovorax sp. J31P207]|uniref:hypothetical protein n=1 Tax=Variovorax sp. J31P207 TaxID=3053510 RepID=UPI002577442D|nr:hypothetical protein [Variovorax sp. J31P207]MDM0065298.1 hypothetical protein [Variovorax sp. J31P207]
MNDRLTLIAEIPPFVPAGSALRNLPVNLDAKKRVMLDAIRYSIEIFELNYRRVIATVEGWRTADGHPGEGMFASVLSDSWAMIDSLHRLQSVVSTMTKKEKALPPYVKVLRDAASNVVVLRNAVQHVTGRIERLVSRRETPWGTISWLELRGTDPIEGWTYTMVPGTLQVSERRSLPSVGGKTVRHQFDLLTLTSDGHSFCLSEAFQAVEVFALGLQESLTKQFGGAPTVGSDMVIEARLDANISPPRKPEPTPA